MLSMDCSKMFFVLNDEEWFEGMKYNIPPVHVLPMRFRNGELAVHFSENVARKEVVLLKRFSQNIHEDLFELLQSVDTLKRMGAKTLTLLLPYYPYARQDHSTINESKGALLLAKMLANLGVNKIITIDMHAPEQLHNFPLKVVNLTTERFWANHLRSLGYDSNKIQIIAADKSAAPRAQQIASSLNCSWGYANKQRDTDGEVQITEVFGGSSEKQTFLVDDVIDTGRTIIAAAQALRKLSPHPIIACATHCYPTTHLLPQLISSGISKLITTDTIKVRPEEIDFGRSFVKDLLSPLKTFHLLQQVLQNE